MLLSKRISRRDTQIAHFGLSSGMNVRDGEIERVFIRARMELLKLFLSNREKPLSFFLYLSVSWYSKAAQVYEAALKIPPCEKDGDSFNDAAHNSIVSIREHSFAW